MLHGRTIARLAEWEERFPVLEWRLGDLHLWPLLRIQLASDLLAAGRAGRNAAGGRGQGVAATLRQSLLGGFSALRPDPTRLADPTPHDAVFLGRPANRLPMGGTWHERFADPLAGLLGERGLTLLHLEHRGRGSDYRIPRERPSLTVTGAVERRVTLARLLPAALPALRGFEELREAVIAAAPGSPVRTGWLARRAGAVLRVAAWFDRLFQQVRPRIGFCTVYYSVPGAGYCLAARRHGIPVTDVQHGVTRGNPAYEGWTRFPPGGFSTLPAWYWAWTEADAEPMRRWPETARPAHRVMVGGQPEARVWSSADPRVAALRGRIPARPESGLGVLVTLSWSSGFSPLLRAVILAAPPGWRWWVRLHPLMDRQRAGIVSWCERHATGRCEVDRATDLPLPLLLEASDVHLTHNSTVVEEAARAGRPSVVVDDRALDVYAAELAAGWAVFAADPAGILAALESQYRRRPAPPAEPLPGPDAAAQALDHLLAAACPATAPAASSPIPAPA